MCSKIKLLLTSIAFLGCAVVTQLHAQEAIGTTTITPPTTTSSGGTGSLFENPSATENQSTAAPLNPTPDSELHNAEIAQNEVSAEPRRFQYGLQITTRGVYDDNINISQTNKVSDYYFTIEPVFTLGAGDISGGETNFFRLDYAPSVFLFADHSEDDAFQQLVHLGGQHRFSRLTLTLGEDIAILDGTDLRSISDQTQPGSHANLDVSGRTKFQTYSTRLNASYDLSGKTFLSTGFDSLVTEYDSSSLFSSATLSENLFINYRYSDKVVFGFGGTAGYDLVDDPNPDQTFEQANLRASYQVSGKVSANFSGGIEFRQFENNSRGEYISPVFELSLGYTPTDATTFSLNASRRTFNSGVLAGQDFAGTTLGASLRQRFLQRFYLGAAGGYQNSDYFSTVNGVAANRQDNYYFFEPSLDFSITRFWTFGGYYLHRQNDSSGTQSFGFRDNQIGFRMALVF
jgi:Putative beta-barrel porin 2